MDDLWLIGGLAAFSALFGFVMSYRGEGDNPQRFMNFVLEGLVLGTAAIVLISVLFFPSWYEELSNQSAFMIVLSTSSIFFALQNVARTMDWRKTPTNKSKGP